MRLNVEFLSGPLVLLRSANSLSTWSPMDHRAPTRMRSDTPFGRLAKASDRKRCYNKSGSRQLAGLRRGFVSNAIAVVIGAVIAALASIVGAFVGTRLSAAAAREMAKAERRTAEAARQEAQLVEVIRLTFEVEYRIFEAAWIAKTEPRRIDRDYADSYEGKMAALLPELSGALVILSGLAPAVHAAIEPWVEEMLVMESVASNALMSHETATNAASKLAPLHEKLQSYYRSAPTRVGHAFTAAGLRP